MRRSPAVALALTEALSGDVDAILANYQPNQYVYTRMRETIGEIEGGSNTADYEGGGRR